MIRPVTTTPFLTRRSIVSGSYAGVSPAVDWAGMYPLAVSAATSTMYDFALRAPWISYRPSLSVRPLRMTGNRSPPSVRVER